MNIQDDLIQKIVSQVVSELQQRPAAAPAGTAPSSAVGEHGVFQDMDHAINAAATAQKTLASLTLEQRGKIIAAIRKTGVDMARDFSERTLAETGMGRIDHKIVKHGLASELTPGVENLEQKAWTGDHGLTVEELAPYGVIGAITPSTHPVPTMISNAIAMIASGNTAVFNAHPGAKKISAYALQALNRAMTAAGGPPNLITCVAEPTMDTGKALFTHPKINLLCVTGGPGVVKAAMVSGKKVIAAGPGNPPVVVDATADLSRAAKDIIDGASFDNNILCLAEKEVLVVEQVADGLLQQFQAHGAVRLSAPQIEALAANAFQKNKSGHFVVNRELVGRSAAVLAQTIGLSVPADTPLLFGETGFDHIFVQEEQMMPFMPIVRVPGVDKAIELALAAEHGYKHTAVMHSRDLAALSRMARVMDTTIFVKNGPSGAGNGVGGEGTSSFSIACSTGDGIITARHFTRVRRCTLVDYFRIV